MTPKQRVLTKYPKAHAYLYGTAHYITQTKESGIVLAVSKTRRAAWALAASRTDGTNPA